MSKINPDLNQIQNKINSYQKERISEQKNSSNQPSENKKVSQDNSKRSDSVKFSNKSRAFLENQSKFESNITSLKNYLKNTDISFQNIHSKIQNSFYNSPELIEDLAEAMVKTGFISSTAVEKTLDKNLSKRLEEIKNNINDGKYFSEEVTEKIANNILKDL
jgi:anti-sigma28 factor (negative regulator of flagellin synthesis)